MAFIILNICILCTRKCGRRLWIQSCECIESTNKHKRTAKKEIEEEDEGPHSNKTIVRQIDTEKFELEH